MLVAVAAGLEHEDHLVDADRLVAPHHVADLLRRADRAAQRAEPLLHQLHAERRVVGVDDLAREARASRSVWKSSQTFVDARAGGRPKP